MGFFIIFTFPHVKTPLLTCIYLVLFLKISLCWHLLILRWKILVVVLSVLYRKGYQCPSIHCLCVSSSKSYWLPSFPSTDSCPIYDLYLPLVSLSIIVFRVFPSEELCFRLLFSECADLLFLPLESQAPVPAHITTLFLVILFSLFVAFPSLA